MPSCGYRFELHKDDLSIRSQPALRDGWRSPLHRPQCRRFWRAEFAQMHTDQTWWRGRPCCLRHPSLTQSAPLNEPHLSTGSVESCGQTAAWEPSGTSWHSTPEFWTGQRNTKQMTYCLHTTLYVQVRYKMSILSKLSSLFQHCPV